MFTLLAREDDEKDDNKKNICEEFYFDSDLQWNLTF
jgi:hypothetical protein